MRIALITQEEPFYLPPALDYLCKALKNEVVALIILPSFNEKFKATVRRLYDFYGLFDFMRLSIWFIWSRLANIMNRLVRLTRVYSSADVARRYKVSLYKPGKINSQVFIDRLKNEIRPDLMISVAASQIFKKRLLEVPPLGCINLHSAPLPRYQGMMPNFWTLLHDEPVATVTVHYMDENLDSGDIIIQNPVPIYPNDSLHKLMIRSKKQGIQALLKAVKQIKDGTVKGQKMDKSQATYFSFPGRVDAQRLRRMGRSLL